MKANGGNGADSLEVLLLTAADIRNRARALGETRNRKLTARAFQQQADELAQCDAKMRAELTAKITKGGDKLIYVPAALRRMAREVREPHMTHPPREVRRLSYLLGDREGCIAELSGLGAGPAHLFALAVEIAAKMYPDAFGEVDDVDALDRERMTLLVQLEQLYVKINESVTVGDLVDLDVDPDSGRARTAFRITKGRVALHPLTDMPIRLVNWAGDNLAQLKK